MAIQAQFFHEKNNYLPDFYNRSTTHLTGVEDGINMQYLLQQHKLMTQQSVPLNDNMSLSDLTDITATASKKRCHSHIDSSATSTSGRPLSAHLYSQNLEIDAVLRLHTERMRMELQEARKRHCRTLVSAVEQQAARRMREKEAELQAVRRLNADLEEKLRQVSGEREVWMSIARNNEAIVAGLRSAVEQLLLREAAGDGEGTPPAFSAEDAESCCYESPAIAGENGCDRAVGAPKRSACGACGGGDVSVLVLPCRHLCLCKTCEAVTDTCPVCRSAKNASLQVFMA